MAGAFEIVMENRREVVEKIIGMMEQGYFFREWKWDKAALRPHNPISNVQYQGGNRIRLMKEVLEKEYQDSRWATLKQYKERGYYPKKGEKGVLCEKWIFTRERVITNENGEKEMIEEQLDKPIVSYFKVFNGEQMQNFPKYRTTFREATKAEQIADHLIQTSECPVKELAQSRAYYSPSEDMIVLPLREKFKDGVSFLNALLHEMGHSTGHKSRLNRMLDGGFGTELYAKEELRAEIGSLFTALDLDVNIQEEHYEDHSDYLKSWIKVLRDDYNELFRACSDAEKISKRLIANYDKKFQRQIFTEEKIESAKPPVKKVKCR